jgi:hypothetical protein
MFDRRSKEHLNVKIKHLLAVAAVSMSVGFVSTVSAESLKPSGTVTIDQTQFGLIIGGSVGGGELTFAGKKHAFKIGGISLGANIGVSQLAAAGEVYNLKNLEDFPGNYVVTGGQVALGGGQGGMQLQNSKGVIMRLDATTKGLQFNVGAAGVNVYFSK